MDNYLAVLVICCGFHILKRPYSLDNSDLSKVPLVIYGQTKVCLYTLCLTD